MLIGKPKLTIPVALPKIFRNHIGGVLFAKRMKAPWPNKRSKKKPISKDKSEFIVEKKIQDAPSKSVMPSIVRRIPKRSVKDPRKGCGKAANKVPAI